MRLRLVGVLLVAALDVSIWEGDTQIEIFLNGDVLYTDEGVQIYPLNSNQIISVSDNPSIRRITFAEELQPGDVIAIRGKDTKDDIISVDLDHYVKNYTRKGGFIGAISNGVQTDTTWKCSSSAQWQSDPRWKATLDDTNWDPAYAYPDDSCCPWRDTIRAWTGLGASWIWAQETDAVTIYCRYVMPQKSVIDGVSGIGPKMNIKDVAVSAAVTDVQMQFGHEHVHHLPFLVACKMYRKDVMLRPPLPWEVMEYGQTMTISELFESAYEDESTIGLNTRNSFQSYPNGTIEWLRLMDDNRTLDECMARCDDYNQENAKPYCKGFTYWDSGSYSVFTCRLLNASIPRDHDLAPVVVQQEIVNMIFHMNIRETAIVHSLQLTDKLFPGTEYGLYCSEDTSSWPEVKETENFVKTEGCFDCGIKPYPEVTYRGGFVDDNTVGITMDLSKAGYVQCLAVPSEASLNKTNITNETGVLTEDTFKNSRWQETANEPMEVMVTVGDLAPGLEYDVHCRTEDTAGGFMPWNLVMQDKHTIRTSNMSSPLYIVSTITSVYENVGTKDIEATFRLSTDGGVWCLAKTQDDIMADGVPDMWTIRAQGFFTEVTVAHTDRNMPLGSLDQDAEILLDMDVHYEVWCVARALTGEGGAGRTPYPNVYIFNFEVFPTSILLEVRVDRAANISCLELNWPKAFNPGQEAPVAKDAPWNKASEDAEEPGTVPAGSRPEDVLPLDETWSFIRPSVPEPEMVRGRAKVYARGLVENFVGGATFFELVDLPSGTPFDVYCYGEDITLLGRKSYGMPFDDVFRTRITARTLGPMYLEAECAAGQNCAVEGFTGVGLHSNARVIIRNHCMTCLCRGEPDYRGTGGECTDLALFLGKKNDLWCYTKPRACPDNEMHPQTGIPISFMACKPNSFGMVEGFGPRSVSTWTAQDGSAFSWDPHRVTAYAAIYALCWCSFACVSSSGQIPYQNYDLRIGNLYVTGPTAYQSSLVHICQAGEMCYVSIVEDIGIRRGDTLISLLKPCDVKSGAVSGGPTENPVANGFPSGGVDPGLAGTEAGAVFTWTDRLTTQGGQFFLCWCGVGDGAHAQPTDCNEFNMGITYTASVGSLEVEGPYADHEVRCKFGRNCRVKLQGLRIMAGDQLMVLSKCGVPEDNAKYNYDEWFEVWRHELDKVNDPRWLPPDPVREARWIKVKDPTSVMMMPDCQSSTSERLKCLQETSLESVAQGQFGKATVPSRFLQRRRLNGARGPSVKGAIVGQFDFLPQLTPAIKDYRICWRSLYSPEFSLEPYDPVGYLVDAGRIYFSGPLVLRDAVQVYECTVQMPCEIDGMTGNFYYGDKLQVSLGGNQSQPEEERLGRCGHPSPPGFPRAGVSLESLNAGESFSWGVEPIKARRGRYNLCWCGDGLDCFKPQHFLSFAGILVIRGPAQGQYLRCQRNSTCALNIDGSGLIPGDRIMPLANCGSGSPIPGFPGGGFADTADGVVFSFGDEPIQSDVAHYRVCWCAGACDFPEQFTFLVGTLTIGGPFTNQKHLCYDSRPCSIGNGSLTAEGTPLNPGLIGWGLRKGDRLLIGDPDMDLSDPDTRGCENMHAFDDHGYRLPRDGVSYPSKDGHFYHWTPLTDKDSRNLMDTKEEYFFKVGATTKPKYLRICWCTQCPDLKLSEFSRTVPAGILVIETFRAYVEQQLDEEDYDPAAESRPLINMFSILIPVVACGGIVYRLCKGSGDAGEETATAGSLFGGKKKEKKEKALWTASLLRSLTAQRIKAQSVQQGPLQEAPLPFFDGHVDVDIARQRLAHLTLKGEAVTVETVEVKVRKSESRAGLKTSSSDERPGSRIEPLAIDGKPRKGKGRYEVPPAAETTSPLTRVPRPPKSDRSTGSRTRPVLRDADRDHRKKKKDNERTPPKSAFGSASIV